MVRDAWLYSFFLSMEIINYETIIKYYEKKWCTIKRGIDTIVYDLKMTDTEYKEFKTDYQRYSINSRDTYFTLKNYPWLEFKTTANTYKHWLSLNVSFTGSDIPTVEALQIYANAKVQKLTIYGLFFRFCELWEFDRQQFYQDICKHIWYFVPKSQNQLRADYKIDIIGVSVNDFMEKLKNNNRDIKKRISTIYQKKWDLETVYLWDKSSKYAFPRVYDKNKDTIKKWKEVFYEEYLKQPTTRLEIQCGSNFIWEMNTTQRLNKVQAYIWEKNSKFTWNYYVWKRYNPNTIISTDFFDKRYLNSTIKAAKSNHNLQPTLDIANKMQNKFIYTCTPTKWLTSIPMKNKPLLKKEKRHLLLKQ